MPDSFDWNNQVLNSIWWVLWVFAVTAAGFALVAWLLMRFTGWGRQFARLAWPYFRPGRTWLSCRPIATFAFMLLMAIFSVRISVLVTYASNGIYTALQELNSSAFLRYMGIFAIIAIINNLGTTGTDVRLDCHDAIAFDEDIAGNEIGDIGIHRHNGAALEEGTYGVRHGELQ